MARRVLVTGSQGFVGKHLRRALVARGLEVVGVDRPGTGAEVEVDLSDPRWDAAEAAARLGPVEGIVYMAATITRGSSVDATARANLQAIVDAAVRMMEAFHAAHGPTHFVYCSTYKTYGPPGEGLIDPNRPPQRPDPHSYGSAKSLAERALRISSARTGARYAIVRPTCIYGPGQHLHNAIPLFLKSCWEGKDPVVFGTGADVRDDVLAHDLAYCLAEACLRKAEGAFHAAGERARTILEVAEVCCRAVEALGGPAGLHPVVDASRPPKWWIDQRFDLGPSREVLGYAPHSLFDGVTWEAQWLRAGAIPSASIDFCPPPTLGSAS